LFPATSRACSEILRHERCNRIEFEVPHDHKAEITHVSETIFEYRERLLQVERVERSGRRHRHPWVILRHGEADRILECLLRVVSGISQLCAGSFQIGSEHDGIDPRFGHGQIHELESGFDITPYRRATDMFSKGFDRSPSL